MKKFWNWKRIAATLILTKSVVFSLGVGYGVKHHNTIARIIDNVSFGNNKIAKGFYRDPYGLKIETSLNKKGEKEVYLSHESGLKVGIGQDGLPGNINDLVFGLENRVKDLGKNKARELTENIDEIRESVYRKAFEGLKIEKNFANPLNLELAIKQNENNKIKGYLKYNGKSYPVLKKSHNLVLYVRPWYNFWR